MLDPTFPPEKLGLKITPIRCTPSTFSCLEAFEHTFQQGAQAATCARTYFIAAALTIIH
jgi:hypothetical protein